jgi:hypothetical protein
MECYEGAAMIKTYRNSIAHDTEDHLRLKTLKGDIGYKIVKFELMPNQPGIDNMEFVVKIYKLSQSSIDGIIDFSDGDLLGAASYDIEPTSYTDYHNVIFDREIFNQDIYITCEEVRSGSGGEDINYYIELEQVKLNENESTMATLQSLRRFGIPRN